MTALLASGALGLLELPEQKAATPHAANFSSQAGFKRPRFAVCLEV
jgi:hypothetical protein